MKKKELISDLIWSFNSGVDEIISESSRNWFVFPEDNSFAEEIKKQDNLKNKTKIKNIDFDVEKCFFEQKNLEDLKSKFSNFLKGKFNENENIFFGKGYLSSKVVLIFDCYYSNFNDKSEKNILKKKKLFENIISATQNFHKLSDEDFLYLSFFPSSSKNVNIEYENYIKICNSFFIKFLDFIESKKIIFVGNFVFNRLKELNSIDLNSFLDKETFVLPGLDIMLRAPERKKMAWETLRDLF